MILCSGLYTQENVINQMKTRQDYEELKKNTCNYFWYFKQPTFLFPLSLPHTNSPH